VHTDRTQPGELISLGFPGRKVLGLRHRPEGKRLRIPLHIAATDGLGQMMKAQEAICWECGKTKGTGEEISLGEGVRSICKDHMIPEAPRKFPQNSPLSFCFPIPRTSPFVL
jgi:hypothetical protein